MNTTKKDKPIPATIVLKLKDENYSGDIFIGLSASLYQNRMAMGKPRTLRKQNDELYLIVTFQDRHSFEHWSAHPNIKKYWQEKFDTYLQAVPQTFENEDVIIEVDQVENCSCQSRDFYLLDGRRMGFIGGLYCGSCLGFIPHRQIPKEIDIENWLIIYEHVYSIWLNSDILEEWALKELSDYKNGELNIEGQKLRKELEAALQKPVYLEYFEEESGFHEQCYLCNSEGEESGLKRPKYICKDCGTAFGY